MNQKEANSYQWQAVKRVSLRQKTTQQYESINSDSELHTIDTESYDTLRTTPVNKV